METPITVLEDKKAKLIYLKDIALQIDDREMALEIGRQITEVDEAIKRR